MPDTRLDDILIHLNDPSWLVNLPNLIDDVLFTPFIIDYNFKPVCYCQGDPSKANAIPVYGKTPKEIGFIIGKNNEGKSIALLSNGKFGILHECALSIAVEEVEVINNPDGEVINLVKEKFGHLI